MEWNKPLPSIDEDIEPFWQACKRHEFVLVRCKKCGAWYWPMSFCRNHDNEPFFGNMEWTKASGKGKVFTFCIPQRVSHVAFKNEVPYVYAIIELDEGPIISSNIIDCDPYEVKVGMAVEVFFKDIAEKFTLPLFRPIK